MKLYAITIEAVAQRTITLAADSLAEAKAAAVNMFDFPAEMLELHIVEADELVEARQLEEAHAQDCPAVDGFGCRCN